MKRLLSLIAAVFLSISSAHAVTIGPLTPGQEWRIDFLAPTFYVDFFPLPDFDPGERLTITFFQLANPTLGHPAGAFSCNFPSIFCTFIGDNGGDCGCDDVIYRLILSNITGTFSLFIDHSSRMEPIVTVGVIPLPPALLLLGSALVGFFGWKTKLSGPWLRA